MLNYMLKLLENGSAINKKSRGRIFETPALAWREKHDKFDTIKK